MSGTESWIERLPWKRPAEWYDDDGADCDISIEGHKFRIRPSGMTGIHSGRQRWTVSCITCGDLIHTGSTSATAQIRYHLDTCDFKKTE